MWWLLIITPAFLDNFTTGPNPILCGEPTFPILCLCLSVLLSSGVSLLIKYICFVKLTKNNLGLVCAECWQWIKGTALIKRAPVCLWAAYISMLISHTPGSCLLSPTSSAWLGSMQMDGGYLLQRGKWICSSLCGALFGCWGCFCWEFGSMMDG